MLPGQDVTPLHHDPLVDALDDARVVAALAALRQDCARAAAAMPDHAAWLARLNGA